MFDVFDVFDAFDAPAGNPRLFSRAASKSGDCAGLKIPRTRFNPGVTHWAFLIWEEGRL